MRFHWGHGILSFLILFLALCTTFIIFSLCQHNDLVTEDYYREGAEYSGQIESNLRSAIFIDSLTLSEQENFLVVTLTPGLSSLTNRFDLYFFRPSDKRHDFRVELEMPGDSTLVERSQFIQGRYRVKLSWEHDEQTYMIEKDLFVH